MNELFYRELDIDNKYNNLIQKEKILSKEEKTVLDGIQNGRLDIDMMFKKLKEKEEELKNKEYKLKYMEKNLNDKEN